MVQKTGGLKYVPGAYKHGRQHSARRAQHYINDWDKTRIKIKTKGQKIVIPPTICFSRKIGVGALQIADILAEKIGYRVADREIIEQIAKEGKLREKTVAYFDERYPGIRNEFAAMMVGEKSFIMSDYSKHLFNVVFSIAGMEPTIFVGRGTHLILPRDRVLAVRCIGSKAYRVKRLSRILKTTADDAERTLKQVDKEQKSFFKKVLNKKDASPYEFDLIINLDHIREPEWAANIVMQAFKDKFSAEI
ncbi:MAG: cytidylate kinase-like family protein [Proteobacteria bacterium]|nr:cytidylate kinase-like family protein [Pseudomonadota bacterium]